MVDPLSAGITSLRAAVDLTKAFVDVRDATKLQSLKFELMSLLVEAQETQAALIDQKRTLEARVRELEAWDREKEGYETQDVGNGVLAYVPKAHAQDSGPAPKLCAACFHRGHKSFLQPEFRSPGMSQYLVCSECGADLIVSGQRHSAHASPPKGRGTGRS
jgi:hypothetical protein